MRKIIVPYVSGNNYLSFETFDDADEAHSFIEQTENRCLMITITSLDTCDFDIKIEDHT